MANQAPAVPFFQVIRRNDARPNKTVTLPPSTQPDQTIVAFAGAAYQECYPGDSNYIADQDNSVGVKLAVGDRPFAGFVTRNVQVGTPRPTYSELAGGAASLPLQSAFTAGTAGSLEDADEYVAEGPNFISSGNGNKDITTSTPIGTKCSFINGTSCVAQAGQVAEYELMEFQTPTEPGNIRCRFRRVYGTTASVPGVFTE